MSYNHLDYFGTLALDSIEKKSKKAIRVLSEFCFRDLKEIRSAISSHRTTSCSLYPRPPWARDVGVKVKPKLHMCFLDGRGDHAGWPTGHSQISLSWNRHLVLLFSWHGQYVLWKHTYGFYNTYRQLDVPTFSSNLVAVDQQVKIVYVGKTGSLDGMRWGWGLRGRNLDCKPCFLTKPHWKWVITFRFSCFTFYLFILDLGLLFCFHLKF